MNNPLVSVIIPVYKVEKYLDRCVESVVNQTYRNLEIILVDDGSPDRCPAMCDAWAEQDERIRVIHKPNGGSSSARNKGLDICTGAYIGFVDSDDWIDPAFYEIMMTHIQTHDAQIGCAGRYDVDAKTMTGQKGLCPDSVRVVSPEKMIAQMLTWQGCDSSCCDKLFLASLWQGLRFPEGKICEDVAVAYKAVEGADRIVLIDAPLYYYFHRNESNSTSVYSSKTVYVITLADEICAHVKTHYPDIQEEARYFKLKTLLHWNRAYTLQTVPSAEEKAVYRNSRVWLMKHACFLLCRCKYVSIKDKLWSVLILLGMKRIIRLLLRRGH